MAQRMFSTLGKIGVGVAVAGSVIQTALFNVDGGHRAVIFDRFRGVQDKVIGEGTHFIIPWVQKPIIYDIRSRPRNVPVTTGSKAHPKHMLKVLKRTVSMRRDDSFEHPKHMFKLMDLQTVSITLRILFRPQIPALPKIYTNLGIDYDERVLPSITNEVLKAVVAQYDAAEMITQREIVSHKVSESLIERAGSFGIMLDDISLTHLTFGTEFTQAVEQKQVAQQDAERARYLVEKAEQVKIAAVITAEGESTAAELLAKAFGDSGEGLVELRKLEAAEDIAHQLARARNVVYLPHGQQTLLALPQ